jgi:hypothetical protein
MSILADVAVPVGLGLALILVIAFLLKGVFGAVIGVPLWLIACFVIGAATMFITPTNILLGFWKFGKEGFVFMDARKTGKMVIEDLEVGTGNAEFIIGEKANPKDPIFTDDQAGVKMDPTMVSSYADPRRHPGGLNIISFGHDSLLPQNHRNHLALKRIIEYLHTEPKMKGLAFMADKEIIELLKKPEHFLEADVKTKVGKYFKAREIEDRATDEKGEIVTRKRIAYFREFQKSVKQPDGTEIVKWFRQEIPINSEDEDNLGIIQLIRRAKSDLDKLPILTNRDEFQGRKGDFFCMNEAFKYNPVSYTAQYASWLKNILQRIADTNAMKWFNWWTMGLIAMGIIGVTIGGIVIGFKVLGMK